MATSDHMIVGYNNKRNAIAVGYGDSFESAKVDYYGPRSRERSAEEKYRIVEVVRYRKSSAGWEEVKDEA